jgi:multiple antibiotic resistance protein
MPFLIGPGTVSASVIAGEQAGPAVATLAIGAAVAATIALVLLIRWLHNRVADRYAGFVDRYTAVVGRVSALVIGTVAVDMILTGIELWQTPA